MQVVQDKNIEENAKLYEFYLHNIMQSQLRTWYSNPYMGMYS